jgi:uncharacterized protein
VARGSSDTVGLVALRDEKYMLLTTFRRSGDPVSTPVWLVELDDGKLGFWTSSAAGKVKRLRHTARVTVQPCNMRGVPTPGTQPVEATAEVVTGAQLEEVRTRVYAKYGRFTTRLTKVAAKTMGFVRRKPFPYADCAVVVSVPQS